MNYVDKYLKYKKKYMNLKYANKGGASLAIGNNQWRCSCGTINNNFFCSSCGLQRRWTFIPNEYLNSSSRDKHHYLSETELPCALAVTEFTRSTGIFLVKGDGMCGIYSIMSNFFFGLTAEDAIHRITHLCDLISVPLDISSPLLNIVNCFGNGYNSSNYVLQNSEIIKTIFSDYFIPFIFKNINGFFKEFEQDVFKNNFVNLERGDGVKASILSLWCIFLGIERLDIFRGNSDRNQVIEGEITQFESYKLQRLNNIEIMTSEGYNIPTDLVQPLYHDNFIYSLPILTFNGGHYYGLAIFLVLNPGAEKSSSSSSSGRKSSAKKSSAKKSSSSSGRKSSAKQKPEVEEANLSYDKINELISQYQHPFSFFIKDSTKDGQIIEQKLNLSSEFLQNIFLLAYKRNPSSPDYQNEINIIITDIQKFLLEGKSFQKIITELNNIIMTELYT